jgi:predicted dehydrogenase
MPLARSLRYGMVGGGPGAFIGAVHRRAAAMDGLAHLVAGAFAARPEASHAMGRELHLDPDRVYGTFAEMAEREAARAPHDRLDFVSIVTPNFLHFAAARAFVERGFHVVCEKPMTVTLEDAETLCRLVAERGTVFALTHTYAGYPMVKQARALVREGAVGTVRKVLVEYTQGWLATAVEDSGSQQAGWRTDPAQAGAGAIGDIGSHAEHVARYITGLSLESLCADVSTMVAGRRVDDDASMLLRYVGGARGALTCSQVLVGEENNLRVRVFGTDAALEWNHADANVLRLRRADRPEAVLTRGSAYLAPEAQRAGRIPAGHPEGYLEAFASLYAPALRTIAARAAGDAPDPLDLDFPDVRDGAVGVHFIHAALRSGREGGWVDARYTPPT